MLALLLACPAPLVVDDTATPDSTPAAAHDTPADSPGLRDTSPPAEVTISEVLAVNRDTLLDKAGDSPDWIELHNAGEGLDLEGWGLSDDPDEPFAFTFPATWLPRGGFVLVYAAGIDDPDSLQAPFGLSGDGDSVVLTAPDGTEVDRLDFGPQRPDVSYGREHVVTSETVVADGSAALLSTSPATGWQDPDHDDSAWLPVTLGLGFDLNSYADADDNLALDQATSQSSDGYGYTGVQAVDGSVDTFSHTGDADLDPWWEVDLGSDQELVEVVLENRRNCCPERLYNLTVSLRDSAGTTTWTSELLNPVAEGGTPSDPGATLTLAPEAWGRHLRVAKEAVNGAGSSEWLSLGEVEAYGSGASPLLATLATHLETPASPVAVRVPFTSSLDATGALLTAWYDDALTVALDGDEALSTELVEHDALADERFSLEPPGPGEHLLAVEVESVDDEDLALRLQLDLHTLEVGELAWFATPTPGEPNGTGFPGFVPEPELDPPRGFHDAPLTVTLSVDHPGASLAYTLDGTLPSAEHGTQVTDTSGTGAATELVLDGTSLVRAVAWADDGHEPSTVATHSYLVLDQVVRQPADPEGFPATWDGLSQDAVAADYEMDPEVVDDPAYTDDLLAGLREIRTLSVVADPDDLFGENGIYDNSLQRGDDWERTASVEILETDGSTGWVGDVGLRIHGYGWRYHSATLKHAFRLSFDSEHGDTELDYALFEGAGTPGYDNIVLRSQGSRGWQDFRDPEQAQYIRDAFARDSAAAMGKLDGHATYVHLYLNGLYWGLYMPVERPDASFGARWLGGDEDDYDAVNRRTSTNEAVDGDLEAYEALLALVDEDITTDAVYDAVAELVELDDLIDYMLLHQYLTNQDGPCCYQHNNMRGVRKREEGAQWRFFVWDMEYTLWEPGDSYNVEIDISGSASHVYARLRENPRFRERYAERAREHLTDGGPLTPDVAHARWEVRADEIRNAVVAESARWGDTDRDTPYTRDVEWEDERARLLGSYFPNRTAALIALLEQAELYE